MQRPKHNSRDLMMMKLSFSPSAIMLVNPLDTTGPPPWLYCHANPAKTPHQDHSPSSKRWIFCLLIIAVFRYQESWLVDQLFPVTSFTRHFHASLVALRTNLAAVGLAILVFQRARLSHTPASTVTPSPIHATSHRGAAIRALVVPFSRLQGRSLYRPEVPGISAGFKYPRVLIQRLQRRFSAVEQTL